MRSVSDNIGKYLQNLKNLKRSFNKIKPEIWLIFIIIFALLIRLHFFVGMYLNDDLCYLDAAYLITQGKFGFPEWIITPRIMMNYPIALFFYLFGVSDFSAALYILLCSIGSVIVSYYIGRTLFGPGTGLASAFLMAIFPIEVVHATTIVPDVPVAFYMGLSVCLFLIGEKSDKKLYYILAGITIGLAWLVKSLAILIILFYISYFLLDKIFNFKYLLYGEKKKYDNKLKHLFAIRSGFILTSLGFIFVLFLEGLLYLFIKNNFFLRFKIETEHYVSTLLGRSTDLNIYPRMLLAEYLYHNYFGLFFIIFCVCIFLCLLFDRNQKLIILITWFLALYLWMQYGTMNFNEYVLMDHIPRFATVWTIPIAVTVGYFIADSKINKKKIFNAVNIIIIGILLISSFYYIDESHEFMEQSMLDYRETADFLKQYPNTNIFTDEATCGRLNFLLGYKRTENLKFLEQVRDPDEIKDAFVIVNASRESVEVKEFRDALPAFIYNPPENWIKVKVINDSYIEALGTYDTIIYYVPG